MRQQRKSQEFTMAEIRGELRMCCSTTEEFRNKVANAARQQGITSQEFVLLAVRDKMRGHRVQTVEEHRAVALKAFYQSKRTGQNFKEAMDKWLLPYMPES